MLFPWPLVLALLAYAVVASWIAWVSGDRWEMVWKTVPGMLFVAAAIVCASMLELPLWRHALSFLVAVVSYFSLELFFLLEYDAPHYPVNGLTHLHVGLVPLTNALLAWGAVGILTFLRSSASLGLLAALCFGAFLLVNGLGFAVTSHPDATRAQRRAWIFFGLGVGFGVACLVLFLPLGMPAQALLSALFVAAPLRLRRYGFSPRPPAVFAWIEGSVFLLLFFGILLFSRWA